jgi:hypothetical protein
LRVCGGGRLGMGLDRADFCIGPVGKIRLKTVFDHGGVGCGDKIEVKRMNG